MDTYPDSISSYYINNLRLSMMRCDAIGNLYFAKKRLFLQYMRR